MATKKATPKEAAPKAVKATGAKVDVPPVEEKKVQKTAKAKAEKTESKKVTRGTPGWLLLNPIDYVVGTENYRLLIEAHNELFGTAYNSWRVRPAVFYTIHQTIWGHFHPTKK